MKNRKQAAVNSVGSSSTFRSAKNMLPMTGVIHG